MTTTEDSGLLEQWWFWTGIGVVVVAATIVAILLASNGSPDYVEGNSSPRIFVWD